MGERVYPGTLDIRPQIERWLDQSLPAKRPVRVVLADPADAVANWGRAVSPVPLLHHEPLALLIVQLELRNGLGFGCLLVGGLDIAKVFGAGAKN